MPVKLIACADGSQTLLVEELDETYHSRHGAVAESMHVYIQGGLREAHAKFNKRIRLLEVGFGTGLNALLSFQEAREKSFELDYVTLETNPVSSALVNALKYGHQTGKPDDELILQQFHTLPFGEQKSISPFFSLQKELIDVRVFSDRHNRYQLIYYDAFGPRVQPELWKVEVFERIANVCDPGAILVTYCAKGVVRRAMEAAGFQVKKMPGPPGKKHMVQAVFQQL